MVSVEHFKGHPPHCASVLCSVFGLSPPGRDARRSVAFSNLKRLGVIHCFAQFFAIFIALPADSIHPRFCSIVEGRLST